MSSPNTGTSMRKFGLLDKFSYAAGDFGCNMSFSLAGTYFTLFYTQFMGIDSLTFAAILLVLKVWDAINDPLIGGFVDSVRRPFRFGKFRTFILYGGIGLMISAALCFLPVPNAPYIVKVILCFLGYMAWDACYTLVNVPYGSMLSVISADPGDRAQLSAWRSLGAIAANLPIAIVLPMLLYDANNDLVGQNLFFTALGLGVIGVVCFLFTVFGTVERVQITPPPDAEKKKFNFFKAILNFLRNRAAMGATLPVVAQQFASVGAGTAMAVMFQSYFQNTALSGLMTLLTYIPMFLFMPFLRKITTRWGQKEASSKGLLISIVFTLLMIVLPIPANGTGILMFVILSLGNGLGMGIYSCLGNAMMANAIDYNEWKNGVRDEGTTYALHSFFRKGIQGIAPSIGLVLMVMLGYDEALGAAQPFEVALNIRYLVAGMYFVSAVLTWACVTFVYNLDKDTLAQMEKELHHSES